ncbi:type II toxin-antitoxin system HicA family toxin [Candidatus Parcubacteria bacterium]|nr:type II toxin-antitoxin system HicA family toxin [Candidatus Parcubacteria bacterium]
MPSFSELPSELNRDKLVKALTSLGFSVSKKGGKGSHIKATFEKNQKSIVIQGKISKNVLKYLLKEIETITQVTWEDIKKKL